MGDRLAGKIALITGAGSAGGIGQAVAQRFAEEGARVYLSDIDADAVAARAAEIGGVATGIAHDATSETAWQQVLDRIRTEAGRLDILINNAGVALLYPIEDMTAEIYERQMAVNLTSAVHGMRLATALMRAQGTGGAIVNISSVCSVLGLPRTHAYAASKAGIKAFGKSVAMETATQGIRINSILPGMIETRMTDAQLPSQPDARVQHLATAIPMGHMGRPEDIANCALYLASDEAAYVTGAEITVDGGMTAI